jgi:hypothetical protein
MIPQQYYFCAKVAPVIYLALIGQILTAADSKNEWVRMPGGVIQAAVTILRRTSYP